LDQSDLIMDAIRAMVEQASNEQKISLSQALNLLTTE